MSLIKQLWIATILLVVIVFSGSLAMSIASSRGYLIEQLTDKNIDHATSLALTISQMEKDIVNLELLLSAQFDSGHYQLIQLSDPGGNIIVERKKESSAVAAPDWFVNLIAMETEPGLAQIQDGWSQYGRIKVLSDARFAYEDLWEGSKSMLLFSLVIALFSALLGSLLLRNLLKPLDSVVKQAEAISQRRFITNSEPKTAEFKAVVSAMNRMTLRIRSMLEEESMRLERLRQSANFDSISMLMNRQYFFSRVDALVTQQEDFTHGVLIIAHLHDLALMDKTLGHEETNTLLRRLGQSLTSLTDGDANLMAGRLSGADFAVFSSVPADGFTLASNIQGILLKSAGLQMSGARLPTIVGKLTKQNTAENLYQLMNSVLADISNESQDIIHVIGQADMQNLQDDDEREWSKLLSNALKARKLKLAHYPVVAPDGKVIHQESPVRMQLREDNIWSPASEFISWANRLNLVAKIDIMVVEKALEELSLGAKDIGLNVSSRAICDPSFIKHVARLIEENPDVAKHLWLEVPERGAFEQLEEFREFCRILKPLGCKIGIEHVGAYVSRLGELHDLGLDYIKIDVSVVHGIDHNIGNQVFFRGLCLIAHAIGLMTIAEGVQTEAEMRILPELGADAMTGPAIK
jgi:EAL domain-containing protein (putative c-di-GMP-specific phosphodiesterase class I)/GGDEF domain-containing protein